MEDDSRGAVQRMLDKDQDDGAKLRGRAQSYAPTVRALLDILQKAGGTLQGPGDANDAWRIFEAAADFPLSVVT